MRAIRAERSKMITGHRSEQQGYCLQHEGTPVSLSTGN